ncbi:ABC transporter ATP-binding protein [Gilvimarinus sp. F26214L]|uniref:ABC transporter ATP-binding protein n=1 Tax=Gilvimarinus sp. DZF01 TaxID=3461371 RepID=UPI00404653B9
MTPLIIRDLRKTFGRHAVLRGVDLQMEAGTVLGLVGLNGAGKTTTLQCMLGLLPFDGGEVSVFGLPPAALYRSGGRVAVVFDEPCLHPHLTVAQTLEHARLLTGADRSELPRLEVLLGIERYHHVRLRDLSLGNRRRCSIAQALVGEPSLIILDEPFNGLDAGGVDDLLALIRKLNRERGISFLLASHQLSYLERICSHMAILHQGRIALADRMDRLLAAKTTRVNLLVSEPGPAREHLGALRGVRWLEEESGREGEHYRITCELQDLGVADLNRSLVGAGIDVFGLQPHRQSLDALFRRITGADSEAGTPAGAAA